MEAVTGASRKTLFRRLSIVRKLCKYYYDNQPKLLGGKNAIVRIDATWLAKKKTCKMMKKVN